MTETAARSPRAAQPPTTTMRPFVETMIGPAARAAQAHYYGRSMPAPVHGNGHAGPQPLGAEEVAFLAARDSFYLATVTADGWPYVQHRGGPPGFLVTRSPNELAFADYGGNRQLITTGNLDGGGRVCLFAVDYPQRARLKVLGTAVVHDARLRPDLVAATAPPDGHAAVVERVVTIAVHAFDWNCPKFLVPRYTEAEVEAQLRGLTDRIAELERQLGTR